MPKKDKERSKLKKMLIQQETEAAITNRNFVKAANQVKDVFELFPALKTCKRAAKDLDVTFDFMWADNVSPDLRAFSFQLMKDNMQKLYESCRDWGWSDKVKMRELEDQDGRHLFAFERESKRPVAFAHIRFIMEDDVKILYIYEMQVIPEYRRRGLGTFMMQVIELVAWKLNMDKCILTVFKDNTSAAEFYKKKLGYMLDETDPSYDEDMEPTGYEILSKTRRIIKKPAAAPASAAPASSAATTAKSEDKKE